MRQLGPFLRENGYEIGDGTIKKLTAPGGGGGPPFKWWGPFKVYGDETTLEWAEGNLREERKPFRTTDRKEKTATP
jgi:hypothetical protein